MSSQIGVIGLAVMGANLARNFASHGFTTSVFNRTYQKTADLLKIVELKSTYLGGGSEADGGNYSTTNGETFESGHLRGNLIGFEKLEEFVESLERPRKIILMVKSGPAVDEFLEKLKLVLSPEDIVIDCGNSHWKDTLHRQNFFNSKNTSFNFIGCGVSGGEEGALHGPSIMPGGEAQIVSQLLPFFEKIAAKDFENKPCVTNVGLGASGHFVKMVHNGIEYAMMQGIAEIYDILCYNSYSNEQIHDVFAELNQGELKSFLLDITVKIFETKDNESPYLGGGSEADGGISSSYLIDKIKDQAGAKGTGSWTVEAALELGVAVPTIAAAVFARTMSARNQHFEFPKLTKNLGENNKFYIDQLAKMVELIFRVTYLQGLELIIEANKKYNWGIDVAEVIRIWQGGCIIRSEILKTVLQNDRNYSLGYQVIELINSIKNPAYSFRPKPVINSVIDYLLTIQIENLPTNLTQAQRDYFGAHTYQRTDREGIFTGGWEK